MLIRKSQITPDHVSEWIRDAAKGASFSGAAGDSSFVPTAYRFSFDVVNSELHRAHSKSFVRMVKPFRRLRRNQGAVNESLIRAVNELCNINHEMAREIEVMRAALADAGQQIQQIRL